MFLFELKFLLQSWFSLNADLKDLAYSAPPSDLSFLSLITVVYCLLFTQTLLLATDMSARKLPV